VSSSGNIFVVFYIDGCGEIGNEQLHWNCDLHQLLEGLVGSNVTAVKIPKSGFFSVREAAVLQRLGMVTRRRAWDARQNHESGRSSEHVNSTLPCEGAW
jgi:hypothetical protein